MLEWGSVGATNIYPAPKEIHEHAHVVKLDITHDFEGWHLEDSARVEFYKLNTRQDNAASFSLGPTPDSLLRTSEGASHVQGMNAIRVERQVKDWWLVSGGYLYSRLDGDASMNQVTVDSFNVPVAGGFWSANDIILRRESHIFSLANLAQPFEWLSASAGVQSEWTRQEGFGNVNLDAGNPSLPSSFQLYPAFVTSDLDKQKLGETASVRFTKIPFTILFGEARFEQESIGQYERDEPTDAGVTRDKKITFRRNTDYDNNRRELRAGFNTSPWKWITLNAAYEKRTSDSDYAHTKIALDPLGYSAFIRGRKIDTDEAQAKLMLRPLSWLKTTLTYKWMTTEYFTTTDPVPDGVFPEGLRAGTYNAHVYGINASLSPFRRWHFSGTFNYSDSRIKTAQNGNPAVVPYEGNVYSVIANATYILSPSADVQAAYSYSSANYGQDNFASGLPLGLDYSRHALMTGLTWRWNPCLTTGLRYAFFKYSEPSTGGFNDYVAHGVFATLSLKWL